MTETGMKTQASVAYVGNAVKKTVRYGTKITPSKKEVLSGGPSTSIISSTSIWSDVRYGDSDPDRRKKFPSITFVQACMDDKKALLAWQLTKIEEMGIPAFRKMQTERLVGGNTFHKVASDLLTELNRTGSLPSLQDILENCKPAARGYVESIYPLLTSLKPDPESFLTEQKVCHHTLEYQGKFDAIFKYNDSVFLIDWKTASHHSAVSKNMEQSDSLSGLYGYPRQLAAYVGAYNADPTYAGREQIRRAAVILAYDDGSEAKVVEVSSEQLESSWSLFLKQLDSYYRAIESPSDVIDFIYRG